MEQQRASKFAPLFLSRSLGDEAAEHARQLGQFDQLIINGEARIGQLTILITDMTDRQLDPVRVSTLIDGFEKRLQHWHGNRLRLIERHAAGANYVRLAALP